MATGSVIIYLAGPIDGIDGDEARNWRETVASQVGTGVLLFSPAHAYMNAMPVNAQSIDWLNKLVIQHSDGVLANLSGPGRGLGTIREIEFARMNRKPVAVVGDLDVHYSAWDLLLKPTMDEGIQALMEEIHKNRQQQSHPMAFLLPGFGTGMEDPGGDD